MKCKLSIINLGTIPTSIGSMTNLVVLFIEMNSMTGILFRKLSMCWFIEFIWYLYIGTVPSVIGALTKLTGLNLGVNKLHGKSI